MKCSLLLATASRPQRLPPRPREGGGERRKEGGSEGKRNTLKEWAARQPPSGLSLSWALWEETWGAGPKGGSTQRTSEGWASAPCPGLITRARGPSRPDERKGHPWADPAPWQVGRWAPSQPLPTLPLTGWLSQGRPILPEPEVKLSSGRAVSTPWAASGHPLSPESPADR